MHILDIILYINISHYLSFFSFLFFCCFVFWENISRYQRPLGLILNFWCLPLLRDFRDDNRGKWAERWDLYFRLSYSIPTPCQVAGQTVLPQLHPLELHVDLPIGVLPCLQNSTLCSSFTTHPTPIIYIYIYIFFFNKTCFIDINMLDITIKYALNWTNF